MAKQLITPDLTVIETTGWCLQYARRVFGAPAVESSAWEAWTNTKFKHEDRNFPQRVAFPVWFDWTGDVGNGKYRYGHVAVRTADGRIWSSPLSGRGSAWFMTVDDLTRSFGGGMKYVGWSEDISNVKVIETGDNMSEVEEILQSALNSERNTNQVLQSALNAERKKSVTFESALNAEREKVSTLSGTISKEQVIDYLTKNLK
jgi:hypothetical protein